MSDPEDLKPGQVINFQLDTDVIKNQFDSCKVMSIANLEMALKEDGGVKSTHASIYDTLPDGTPKNPEDFNYLIVELIDGTIKAFGIPWIKSPVTVVTSSVVEVVVNSAGASDVARITKALNVYGYSAITVSVVTT